MIRWFRMHNEILDDPKVQKLSPEDFKSWVNILCVASQNDGRLPDLEALAFRLRVTLDAVSTTVSRLLDAGLIDSKSGGPHGNHHAPHNWEERQYKSDTSTERVKRFRQRYMKQDETVSVTAPDTDSEQIQKREEKSSSTAKRGARLQTDFIMPAEWLDWAKKEKGWSALDAHAESQSFIDFWHAKAGKDGAKLDWQATWRNWCRNSRRQSGKSQRALPPGRNPAYLRRPEGF